jgi:hypothetical protein
MEMRGCEAWLKVLRRRKVQHDVIKIGVMLSQSKHSGRASARESSTGSD